MPFPEPLSPHSKSLRLIAIAGVLSAAAGGLVVAAGWWPSRALTPAVFVDTQESGGIHAGFRRAHAKGFCVTGTFTSSGALAETSSAQVFAHGSVVPVLGRISTAGGNPSAPDASSPVRSLALQFQLADGQQWRTAMNTPPVLAVATPEKFHQQLQALAPVAATGKPDPARIAAFFAAHPESAEFLAWQAADKPSSSFATTRYHSINAFVLVAADGARKGVRWAAVPQATPEPLGEGPHDRDALQDEFAARIASAPVRWALEFTLAAPSDVTADATRSWPEPRQHVTAGVLELTAASPQQGGDCNVINFDPLVLPRGIEGSDDPILAARSATYAESLRRRARESRGEASP